jgi:7-cyano-7-deazaguanine reductase
MDELGNPAVGMLRFSVPAVSSHLVESKSIKLYLGSFTFERFASPAQLEAIIRNDLSRATGGSEVSVVIDPIEDPGLTWTPRPFPGTHEGAHVVSSHALRSLCPVTGQPDHGSCIIVSSGERVSEQWLLDFLTQHRNQEGFHEECCERIFLGVTSAFSLSAVSVGCFYTRRGDPPPII